MPLVQCYDMKCNNVCPWFMVQQHFTAQKAIIHQVTTMLVTSKNVLFPGHNHLLTTGADDLIV